MFASRSFVRPWALACAALLGVAACAHEQTSQPVTYAPNYGQPGSVTPGTPTTPGTVAGSPPPAPTVAGTPGTVAPTLTAIGPTDPIIVHDITFLRTRAQQVLNDLVAALPQPQQSRVTGIPLVVDATPGEVNAFATCSGASPALAITDGLLQIESQLARFRAVDELAGSNKVGDYIALIARGARPKQALPEAPPGFVDPRFDFDPRKGTRQYELLDEQLAFVMGHELGHHYLGHLPCTAVMPLNLAQIGALLSNAVPAFNQPNEVAADMVGINNTLTMGARRPGYHLTEGGALLTMQFFAGLDQLTPADILFGFERDHPPPQLRTPIIQQTAAAWRATGGAGLPILGF
ncbi:MAG TPA: M48 family metalloprotease [Polyangiaceae bacterium]|nr:M48 family metalloprotease [Polyangiaceae bacterium]